MSASRIFISYRRGDSSAHAGRLSDRLAAEFGEDSVFMDVDTIEPGADFVDYIEEAVGGCDVLIALIGDEWLSCQDDLGNRRLDDPEDFVRLEVAAGLERDIRVVPVLVEGAVMPRAHELPDPLQRLARRNALEITDTRWRHDAGRLIQTVKKVLEGKGTGEAIQEAQAEMPAAPVPTAGQGPPASAPSEASQRPPWAPAPAVPSPEPVPPAERTYGAPSYAPASAPSYDSAPPPTPSAPPAGAYGAPQGTAGGYQPPPSPAGPAWQAPSSAYYTAHTPKANSKATWALVLALVSIFPGWVFGLGMFTAIPAVILGAQAKGAAERGEAVGGAGMAKAAIWIAVAAFVLAIGFWVMIALLPE